MIIGEIMNSSMTIDVEFLAGTSIEDATEEAKTKAIQLDLAYVRFKFNGVEVSIGKNANIEDVLSQYRDNRTFIISA